MGSNPSRDATPDIIQNCLILSNPFAKVRIPKPSKNVIPTFSEGQIQALLGVIHTSTQVGFRDWKMILTLFDTGLRASFRIGLTVKDINLHGGIVKVNGKGTKEKIVPIRARVQSTIWKYLRHYRSRPVSTLCNNLFLTNLQAAHLHCLPVDNMQLKVGRK